MKSGFAVRKNQYFDSVFLMGINNKISMVAGVENSAVLMGTDNNKSLLSEIGISGPEIESATPNDLIVAVSSKEKTLVNSILADLEKWLEGGFGQTSEVQLRTLEDGVTAKPNANLATISVPGAYAFKEAKKALENGLNVFLFSDNVPASEELETQAISRRKRFACHGTRLRNEHPEWDWCRIRQQREERSNWGGWCFWNRPTGIYFPNP